MPLENVVLTPISLQLQSRGRIDSRTTWETEPRKRKAKFLTKKGQKREEEKE
jgi:hypothetical protein